MYKRQIGRRPDPDEDRAADKWRERRSEESTTFPARTTIGDHPAGLEPESVSYTHLRAHETPEHLVCRLLLEKKNQTKQ